MDTINQHILLYYNLYGGDGDGADGDGDGDGDDKICRFLGNKSTYHVVLLCLVMPRYVCFWQNIL